MTHPSPDAVLDAPGIACVTLTPLVSKTIKNLPPGAVLEVRSDDPASLEGVPSWCRLTNNQLISTVEHDQHRSTFFIQHKAHAEPTEEHRCPTAS